MSTWTSRASCAIVLTALTALAGCTLTGGDMRSRPLLGGAVTLAAPSGYCIDPDGVMEADGSAMALIGRCASGTAAPAILTATVGGPGSGQGIVGSGEALSAFFTSNAGRAALSREGRADSVTVAQALASGDAFLIRLADRSATPPESWRAVLPVRGRLVTLTVAGAGETALSAAEGRALIDRFVASVQAVNRRDPQGTGS